MPLPDTRGRRPLVAAVAVDTLGVGLFLPLSFYFFTVSTTLSVARIGVVVSAATFSALALAPVGGLLTDRWGARNMVVASNVLTAVGYFCYPFASTYQHIFGAVLLVMLADRLYYAAWPTLIAAVARRSEIDAWYGLVQAVSAGSLGVGALVSSLLLLHGTADTLRAIVIVNALTSVLAAVLTATLRRIPANHWAGAGAAAGGTVRAGALALVLRDRAFLRLLLAQLMICTAWIMPAAFLPLYVVRTLGLAQWQAMAVFSLNYLLLFALQLLVTHTIRRARRTRAIVAGAATFLAAMVVMAAAAWFTGWRAMAWVVAGMAVYTIGEMLVAPAGTALAATVAPPHLRGTYMSLFQLTGAIAFGLGPGLTGLLFGVDARLVLLVLGGCVAFGAGVVLTSERLLPPGALRPTVAVDIAGPPGTLP